MRYKRVLLFVFHIAVFLVLTLLTQIGGIVYVLSLLLLTYISNKKRYVSIGVFSVLYLLFTFLIIPYLAPVFGRERIKETNKIELHSFFYRLANRNYVTPELNRVLVNISKELDSKHKGVKLVCLDANFPFFNGFPLFPHLSHNDGKKIDVSFVYKDDRGKLTNKKPSVSGYGVYEKPKQSESNQPLKCKKSGAWQYSFPQYLTFGKINNTISFSKEATKTLVNAIVKQAKVSKLFIEPHLKQRMQLSSSKVRFHGCRAVRHDDHIHFQIR